jgi:hypothetical protein
MRITTTNLLALTLLAPALQAQTLTVPGTANPWLAGMPDGSIAFGTSPDFADFAPAQSPVAYTPIVPGSVLSFTVVGSVNNNPYPSGLTPDGGVLTSPGLRPAENGIAGFEGAANSLLGVFLSDSPPSPPTNAAAVFPYLPNGTNFTPGLKQAFFIGDGLTGTGSGMKQSFVVPAGATRLFLGSADTVGWSNNYGSFSVTVTVEAPPTLTIRVSQVEVCWNSLTNSNYQLQYQSDLTTNTWVDLGATVPGNGTTNCVTDTVVLGEPKKFYRIVVVP